MDSILNKNKIFWKDVIVMTTIIILPFAFFLYNLIPINTKLLKVGGFEIESGFHPDVNQYFWYLSIKMLTLILLSIWFVTCKFRWRYAILFPVIFEIYKINVIILIAASSHNPDAAYIESLMYSLPFILILILISRKMGYQKLYKYDMTIVNEEINSELIKLSEFKVTNYIEVKKELKALQRLKSELNEKEYLVELISLRDRLNSL